MNTVQSKPQILVIDDEGQIRRLLKLTLEDSGYSVFPVSSGEEGLREVLSRHPDVVILDLGLGDMEGLEVLRRLREWSQIPVLVLSVLGEQETKVKALDLGADDYLTKPFGESELVARLRALMRRRQNAEGPAKIQFGAVEIDFNKRLVLCKSEPVKLTTKEYALLRLFIANRGKLLTVRQILASVWGPQSDDQSHYVHVYMARLRQKLEEQADDPKYFLTESGVGYRFTG